MAAAHPWVQDSAVVEGCHHYRMPSVEDAVSGESHWLKMSSLQAEMIHLRMLSLRMPSLEDAVA